MSSLTEFVLIHYKSFTEVILLRKSSCLPKRSSLHSSPWRSKRLHTSCFLHSVVCGGLPRRALFMSRLYHLVGTFLSQEGFCLFVCLFVCLFFCVRFQGKYIQGFLSLSLFFFLNNIYLFIWLHWVLVEACVIFTVACEIFRHGMWALVPKPQESLAPGPPG